jgi:hypothetical protein
VIDAGVPEDADGAARPEAAVDVRGRKVSFAGAGADGDVVLLIRGWLRCQCSQRGGDAIDCWCILGT